MMDKRRIGKGLGGAASGLTEVVSRYLLAGIDESHENSVSTDGRH